MPAPGAGQKGGKRGMAVESQGAAGVPRPPSPPRAASELSSSPASKSRSLSSVSRSSKNSGSQGGSPSREGSCSRSRSGRSGGSRSRSPTARGFGKGKGKGGKGFKGGPGKGFKGGKGHKDRGYDRASPRRRGNRSLSRSGSPARRNGGASGQQKGATICWFGRDCNKPDCWFSHPDGRHCDDDRRAGGAPGNRRAPLRPLREPAPRCERRAASPSKSRSSSPAKSRSPRSRSPRRSVSKSSQPPLQRRPPSPTAPAKPMPPAMPAAQAPATLLEDSFHYFVMNHTTDTTSPEEALVMFGDYRRQLAERALQPMRVTKLFYDMYHPVSKLRHFDLRVRTAHLNAAAFAEDLNRQVYAELSLRATAFVGAVRRGPLTSTSGHLQPPHFAFNPDVDAVVVSAVPKSVSAWDLYNEVAQCPGLVAFSWTKPTANVLAREVRFRFASLNQARAALAALSQAPVLIGAGPMRPALLDAPPELTTLVLPPEMSLPARIAKDVVLAGRVVCLLNSLMGVPPATTEAVLKEGGCEEKQLDVRVLYLRRVHHFCFYAGTWFHDEWQLRDACGVAAVRDSPPTDNSSEGAWSQAHEKRLEHFLKTAALQRPKVLTGDDPSLQAPSEELCAYHTAQVTAAKFQCKDCGKYFKGTDYVNKHLRRIHANLFEDLLQKAREDTAAAAFLADPRRPTPQLPPRPPATPARARA